jgi:hypothetical protein
MPIPALPWRITTGGRAMGIDIECARLPAGGCYRNSAINPIAKIRCRDESGAVIPESGAILAS